MQFLDQMMKDCAQDYSNKGDMRILQRHLYIGIIFDTFRGRIFIGKDKFDKTMALLLELMEAEECTPFFMAKLRGKVRTSISLHRRRASFRIT